MEERKGAGFRLARTVKICRGGRALQRAFPKTHREPFFVILLLGDWQTV
jgi:hypothetical protein